MIESVALITSLIQSVRHAHVIILSNRNPSASWYERDRDSCCGRDRVELVLNFEFKFRSKMHWTVFFRVNFVWFPYSIITAGAATPWPRQGGCLPVGTPWKNYGSWPDIRISGWLGPMLWAMGWPWTQVCVLIPPVVICLTLLPLPTWVVMRACWRYRHLRREFHRHGDMMMMAGRL